jgi:hypothetical protein
MKKCAAEVNNQLDRVEERLDLLTERALRTELSAAQIKQNSVERLETINQRFDEMNETIKANNQRDRWVVTLLFGVGIGFASTVFYLWMEPMEEQIDKLENSVIELMLNRK